jgi:NAD(P)-dependent dehydrogenase (short-subunit alcohol dehydrogenase family)
MALNNPFDFSGKTVVLAGACGGLGRPIAVAFAKSGADIAMCDKNRKALTDLNEEIKGSEGTVLAQRVDLLDQKEVQDFTDQVIDKFRKIDALVNLVGGIIRKPSMDYTIGEWEQVMDTNLKTCWICCQTVGKVMIQQKYGRIINFSSGAGLRGIPSYPAYTPAKAGVIALTKVLAVEWGPFGISTNAVAPGFTDTPFNAEVLRDDARVQGILKRMPLGKIMPDDAMVGPTLFLASDAARWINGQTLNVDSGFSVT